MWDDFQQKSGTDPLGDLVLHLFTKDLLELKHIVHNLGQVSST